MKEYVIESSIRKWNVFNSRVEVEWSTGHRSAVKKCDEEVCFESLRFFESLRIMECFGKNRVE